VTAARASGAFLITVPSQLWKRFDGDYVTPALVDPLLAESAQKVTTGPRSEYARIEIWV
jgi:hypothetical protein